MSVQRDGQGRRRWPLLAAVATMATAAAVALALFQPWKLWVDDTVDQAAPAGAVAITVTSTVGPEPPVSTVTAPPPTAPSQSTSVPVAPTAPATTTSTTVAPTTVPPPTSAPIPAGEPFISLDHGTAGRAVLLEDGSGARFVRLEDLDTSNGPDLFVYLSANPPDGPESAFDDDYVNLGRLAGNVGSSNYAIPPDTDLSRFASVVIWCDRFDSAFGAAPLT